MYPYHRDSCKLSMMTDAGYISFYICPDVFVSVAGLRLYRVLYICNEVPFMMLMLTIC